MDVPCTLGGMYGALRPQYHGGMERGPVTKRTSVDTDDRRIAEARRQEISALAAMDGLDLADETIMAKAWH